MTQGLGDALDSMNQGGFTRSASFHQQLAPNPLECVAVLDPCGLQGGGRGVDAAVSVTQHRSGRCQGQGQTLKGGQTRGGVLHGPWQCPRSRQHSGLAGCSGGLQAPHTHSSTLATCRTETNRCARPTRFCVIWMIAPKRTDAHDPPGFA